MDAREFKRLARLLSLPAGGKPLGNDSWSWSKRGGYAGEKTVARVKLAAQQAGWTPSDTSGASPDGSTVSHGTALVSPEGHKLSTSASYGGTKADNRFSIYLTLAPAAAPAVKTEESFEQGDIIEATELGREILKEGLRPADLQEYLMNAGYNVSTAHIAARKAVTLKEMSTQQAKVEGPLKDFVDHLNMAKKDLGVLFQQTSDKKASDQATMLLNTITKMIKALDHMPELTKDPWSGVRRDS